MDTFSGYGVVSNNRSTETTAQVKMKLSDIPKLLVYNYVTYELRGVISLQQAHSKLRTSSGHYNAYAIRGTKNCQLFDDLKKKPIPVKENKEVSCELLVYTI